MKTTIRLLSVLCSGLLLQGCATSKGPGPNWTADDARAYLEVLRADYNGAKIRTLNEVMKLSAAEGDKFWPIYRSYQADTALVGDRKLALTREWLTYRKAGTLTDEKSRELVGQLLQNAQDRLDLWKRYSERIAETVSPLRAAQFLQVENRMPLIADVTIASDLPMVGTAAEPKK